MLTFNIWCSNMSITQPSIRSFQNYFLSFIINGLVPSTWIQLIVGCSLPVVGLLPIPVEIRKKLQRDTLSELFTRKVWKNKKYGKVWKIKRSWGILRDIVQTKNKIRKLNFRKAKFQLFRELDNKTAMETALKDKEVKQSWQIFKEAFLSAQELFITRWGKLGKRKTWDSQGWTREPVHQTGE